MKILPALIPTTISTRADNPLKKAPGEVIGESAPIDKASRQSDGKDPAIAKATKQFESYFLNHMFKVMRETIPKDGLFKQSYSNDTYTSMLDQEYSRILSDAGGFGLAAVLERQLSGRTDQPLESLEEMLNAAPISDIEPE